MTLLVLMFVAAAPRLPPELAACKFADDGVFVFNEDCDSCLKVKPLGGGKYEVHTLTYGNGRNASASETWWLADAKGCTAVGLEGEGGGGSPVMATSFVHTQGRAPPTGAEQAQLQAMAGFVAADRSDARDQLAYASTPQWMSGSPQPQRTSWKPVTRDGLEGKARGCPCFELFAGGNFKRHKTLQLGKARLHLFATSARNQSWAYALERDGKTLWGELGMRLTLEPRPANGRHFVLETTTLDEVPRQTVLIDSETGEKIVRGNTPSDEPLGNP